MLWSVLFVFFGLAAARHIENVSPEYLEALRESGNDEEYARLMGLDVSLVRPTEERSEGSRMNRVSHLGDIVLSEEQERQGLNFKKYGGSRWPNGRIPYQIQERDFSPAQLNTIREAIKDFNSKVSKVKLEPRRRRDRDYVHVISGNGCWSYLGRTGGQQALSLQKNGCVTSGTVQHEFMHAAGFTHEHNRADRDDYVRVRWEDISEDWHSQYEKVDEENYLNILEYDYDSVMHYPMWSPGMPGKDAFDILTPGVHRDRLGQDEGVSDMDVKKLNALYS